MRTDPAQGRVLIAVAHPDDETIFMGGLIRRLGATGHRVDIACATSRFSSPLLTSTRRAEFQRACWQLGARAVLLGFADEPGPLPATGLVDRIKAIEARHSYASVYTHGVWGEYGHRHHRDVCLAVHRVFGERTYCLAGPLEADIGNALSPSEVDTKRRLASAVYCSQPGIAAWCSEREQFARVPPGVAEALIAIANGERPANAAAEAAVERAVRCRAVFERDGIPFPEVANIPAEVWKPMHRQFAASLAAFAARSGPPKSAAAALQ
jgi:LmbE family N-acetylglucosaminyl deacetylase